MFLAIVDFETWDSDRAAAVAHLEERQARVRAMRGCSDFRVVVPTASGTRVTVLHEWEREADFGAYTSSEEFSGLNEMLRPLMTAAPRSRRFRAELVDVVA